MSNSNFGRVDEVSQYYKTAAIVELIGKVFFWVIIVLSLCMPYSEKFGDFVQSAMQVAFIVIVLIYFIISQVVRFFLVPRAERMRRKQMLSDAFGTPLSHDKTLLYYNNDYSPSILRLGANTMENSLFSKEVAARMLGPIRWITGGYLAIWLLAFSLRHNNLEILILITQIIFSGEIIVQWLNLEVLYLRHERTYEQLHTHFLHNIGATSSRSIATVLDCFVAYESAKSSAGILLSSKVFEIVNPKLTEKWSQIRQELQMGAQ